MEFVFKGKKRAESGSRSLELIEHLIGRASLLSLVCTLLKKALLINQLRDKICLQGKKVLSNTDWGFASDSCQRLAEHARGESAHSLVGLAGVEITIDVALLPPVRSLYAVCLDPEVAKMAGINFGADILYVFIASGLLVAGALVRRRNKISAGDTTQRTIAKDSG